MLDDRIAQYLEREKTVKDEKIILIQDIEREIIERYLYIIKQSGESIDDIYERGGTVCLPLSILILKEDGSCYNVNGIHIGRRPFSHELYLIIDISGKGDDNKVYPFFHKVDIHKLSFDDIGHLYKGLKTMGFFDDSRIDLFPDV